MRQMAMSWLECASPIDEYTMNKPGKSPRRFRERPAKAKKLRCFIGIKFTLAAAIDELRKALATIADSGEGQLRLVPDDNLHITLKFIGSVEEAKLASIEGVLKQVAARYQGMQLQAKGMGMFKNSAWVGIEEHAELSKLASDLNLACVPMGILSEGKTYQPHVTVARFNKETKAAVAALQQKYAEKTWGDSVVSSICLYRSDTLAEGAKYTVIDEVTLGS